MLGSLRNRLTKFATIGFALAFACLILGVTIQSIEGSTLYLTIFAVTLLVASVFVEGYGVYETRHFLKEDALEVYQTVTRLITELRTLSENLHKEHGHTPEGRRRYVRDKRYRKLLNEFARVRMKCKDYRLGKKIQSLIEQEKLSAKYAINTDAELSLGSLETTERHIRNYIDKRFRSREVLPVR